MTKLAPEWVRTSDPVIRSPARYRWTTAPTLHVTFNTVVQDVLRDIHITYSLKEEQLLYQKKNTFTVLPTGFGKSDIFGLLPLNMDKVRCVIL